MVNRILAGCAGIFILSFLLSASAWGQTRDAQIVKTGMPDTLTTSQVFACTIAVKNTGTDAWYESMNNPYLCELRSQDTAFNTTWGTSVIILGQGNRKDPGDTNRFTANVRAPATPGTYLCSWQMYSYNGSYFFGDTAKKSIVIVQGDTSGWVFEDHGQNELTFDDFEYVGSFTTPQSANEDYWSNSPLALRVMPDGSRRVFMRSRDVGVYEAVVPDTDALLKVVNGDLSGLPSAQMVRILGTMDGNCGLYWDDSTHILYSSYFEDYYTGAPFNTLYATQLSTNDADVSKTAIHGWKVPTAVTGLWRGYQFGVTVLSREFADTYTGGRQFAVGFGGYFSICGNGVSRGPCLGAIARPQASADTLDMVPLLGYHDGAGEKAMRDGNYFASGDGMYWYDTPANLKKGYWCSMDEVWSGVFIDLPDQKAYISFSSIGIGRNGYDYGAVTRGGTESHWYFYSLDSLGAAAAGLKTPGSLQPYSIAKMTYPTTNGVSVTGSCLDSENRLLYVNVNAGAGNGKAMINAYRIKQGPSAVENAAAHRNGSAIDAYPNPFNPAIKIAVSWQHAAGSKNVRIDIFNVHGKKVQTLHAASRMLSAGITWNATGQPSGVYLVQAKTGTAVLSKKISLLK